jgi:hypothetical protein
MQVEKIIDLKNFNLLSKEEQSDSLKIIYQNLFYEALSTFKISNSMHEFKVILTTWDADYLIFKMDESINCFDIIGVQYYQKLYDDLLKTHKMVITLNLIKNEKTAESTN